jgi:hypothetical protein
MAPQHQREIPLIDAVQMSVWIREALRIARLAVSTRRAIHAKALKRHLEGVSQAIGGLCK